MRPLDKYPGGSEIFDINCTNRLGASEVITSVTSVTALPSLSGADALTFGTATINATQIIYSDGVVAPIGKVVQVRVSGGTSVAGQPRRSYTVIATCNTSAGNILVAKALMYVHTLSPDNALA